LICWDCEKSIEEADAYCRYCGKGQGGHIPWYYHPLGLTFLALFALGPLTLPLIWKSPKLEARGRWVGTILLTALTCYLISASINAYNMLKAVLSETSFAIMPK